MEQVLNEIGDRMKGFLDHVLKEGREDLALLKNVPDILAALSDLTDEDLLYLMAQLRKVNKLRTQQPPPVNGDFYEMKNLLSAEERVILDRVGRYMKDRIEPIAADYWLRGEFPMHIIPELRELKISGLTVDPAYGGHGRSFLLEGMIAEEIARTDVSVCTFFGVHNGLAMNSIVLCGSEQQKREFLPAMINMDRIGAFALTEPEVGSAISVGLKTSCRRRGDTWVLNGQKKWIGNASFADHIIVWARDEDDHQVKGFIVDRETAGLSIEKIEDKIALRIVQNALITFKDCPVSEERRLPHAQSFKDTANVLKMTRAGVAWQAVGCARGAYEYTLDYTLKRQQFGRPIAGFQMTQDLLSQMLSQITAMQTMVSRLSQLQDLGVISDAQASLAKVFCTVSCRQVTSMSRELMGANGILISNRVGKFLGDAEALYSYEGTKQINSLIVGRTITGISAFT